MVTFIRPPPDAIAASTPFSCTPLRKSWTSVKNLTEEPSGTSRPSVSRCRRTRFMPRSTQPLISLYTCNSVRAIRAAGVDAWQARAVL